MSINVNQPGAREDVWQARPGGDGSPAARDAGGSGRLAVWFTGAAARRSRCAPGRFVLIGLVDRDGTLVVMAAICAVSFIWIQLMAQRHGLVVGLLRARTRPGQVAQRRACVGDGAVVEVASSPVPAAGWSSGCGSGAACVAGC